METIIADYIVSILGIYQRSSILNFQVAPLISPIMENQMEKKNAMETETIWGKIRAIV